MLVVTLIYIVLVEIGQIWVLKMKTYMNGGYTYTNNTEYNGSSWSEMVILVMVDTLEQVQAHKLQGRWLLNNWCNKCHRGIQWFTTSGEICLSSGSRMGGGTINSSDRLWRYRVAGHCN